MSMRSPLLLSLLPSLMMALLATESLLAARVPTRTANVAPRRPVLPPATPQGPAHPIDRLLILHKNAQAPPVPGLLTDHAFARRVHLDLVGLLPSPSQLKQFLADPPASRRELLVDRLLADRQAFAAHWMVFWNDRLRNAYRGTGFIDDGRRQITGWLYRSLYNDKPYDRFAHELVSPVEGSGGFIRGIKWRGVVNASQEREVQAAQGLAQVFLGTNLKCASCHDSFINDWKLDDAYALAAVFADKPLELHRCNKPTGKTARVGFLFPSLGTIVATAKRPQRLKRLADLLVTRQNGRFTRTIVNRLWAALLGRGLVEPLDEMERAAWHPELLDWLAEDLADHKFDLKHTLKMICTSGAYQRLAVPTPSTGGGYLFRGPYVKRMTAEQFVDALAVITNTPLTADKQMTKRDGRGQGGQLPLLQAVLDADKQDSRPLQIRAAFVMPDALQRAMGRPNREQIVTRRDSLATMLEAMELTNGKTLDKTLKAGAAQHLPAAGKNLDNLLDTLFLKGLSRQPAPSERRLMTSLAGSPVTSEGLQDVLWSLLMHPDFQLIH
jgi:hypothetical protein